MSAKLKEFGSISCFKEIFALLEEQENRDDIKNYLISASGFGDLICFGFKIKLMIASQNCSYNSNDKSNGITFNISSQEDICDENNESVYITSLLVLPISSSKQSSQGLPDWTCVCVGLSSGHVKFFNQFGQLIFSQKFSFTPIKSICLRSGPRYGQQDLFTEDLMILCDNCCYQIEGIYLYESLNTFKKQLARFQAGFLDDQLDSFELGYKKWILDMHESVSDIVFGYEASESTIDSVFNNVTSKGPYLAVPEETPRHINCVVAGKSPCLAFYRLPLDNESLDMGDLAHAVFSKVKGVLSTSLSSWMGGFSNSTVKQPSPKLAPKKPENSSELPSRLQSRHLIEEPRRYASTIIGCPLHDRRSKLAAITDDHGRIFLLDLDDGIVLRMWKGYREAQISICSTSDGVSSTVERSVNFLVIYAPRRSIIEVWTLPFGEKVASFDVRDRNGRLMHVPHTSLGSSRNHTANQRLKSTHSTFFLDSSGKLSVLEVPFHLSLSSSSSERSQDHLVLKHFRSVVLRREHLEPTAVQTEAASSLRVMRLPVSMDSLVTSVLHLTQLPHETILAVVDDLIDLLRRPAQSDAAEADCRRLLASWIGTRALLVSYLSLTGQETAIVGVGDSEHSDQEIGGLLNLESDDCDRITNLYKYYCVYNPSTTRTSKLDDSSYLLFVNNFSILPNFSSKDEELRGFQLTKNIQEQDVLKIGTVLFRHCILRSRSVEDVIDVLSNKMKVDQSSSFRLCLTYLINESPVLLMDNLGTMKQLLIHILSKTSSIQQLDGTTQYRLIKTSQQLSYECIEKSSHLMSSLFIAMTIRVIILELLHGDAFEEEEIKSNLGEFLSSWNEICQRLEDLTIFDCFLKCRPLSDDAEKPKLPKVSFEREIILFSVLECGKGVFSERFAKWAIKWSLKYHHIHGLYKSLAECASPDGGGLVVEECPLSAEVKGIFAILYKQLPHSLEYDSVLINTAWEYTRMWSKSLQRLEYLENACQLLESIGEGGGLVIQGIVSMIWDMHLVVGLVALFPMDAPPQAASVQKYSSQLACDVTSNIIRLLKMLLAALDNADVVPTFTTEAVWQGDKSRSSLIDLAVSQELVAAPAVQLHIDLLLCLQLRALLAVERPPCLSLLPREARPHVFRPLTTVLACGGAVTEAEAVDLRRARQAFVEECVHACVARFACEEGDRLCLRVNGVVKVLADRWGLDHDQLLRDWIEAFYSLGLDSQAAMYLDKVQNLPLLAISLLKIVGLRIKKEYLLPECRYHRECAKYVTVPLRRWLAALEDRPQRETVLTGLDESSLLLDQVLEWLPENCLDFEAATCLQSVLLSIQRTKKYVQ